LRIGLALGAVALVALVALGAETTRSRAELVIGNGAEVASLDPALASGVPEQRALRALFEGLVVKDPRTLEPRPGVAERWEATAESTRWIFHLRADARWSNGDPVTAQDFVASWERVRDPATGSPNSSLLEVIAPGGTRALDARTLEVELAWPMPNFLDLAAHVVLMPIHAPSLELARARHGERWSVEWLAPGALVSNGPYRLVERRVNDRLRLEKSPSYWDAASVAIATLDLLAVDHYGTLQNLYLSGDVDWIDRLSPAHVARLHGRPDFHPVPYLATYFYRVNVTRPPLDDPRVRRALALAIDRRAICERVTKGGQLPSWSLVPPGLAGYAPAELAHADLASDCAAARALLAAAGFERGVRDFPTLRLHFNTSEAHRDLAEVLADGWRRELGIDARLENQEWKVYQSSQRALEYDVSRSVWIGDLPDPANFLEVFASGGSNNRTGWSSARYDELLSQARHASEPAQRARILGQAETLLFSELPILPLFTLVTQNLVDPDLQGFHENLTDEHFPKFLRWRAGHARGPR
jgi:oligopeptide transport system substrate-binding protein